MCTCVWLTEQKRRTDFRAFINLVWTARRGNLLKCIWLNLCDGVPLKWQRRETNIAHSSKVVLSSSYHHSSWAVLMISVLSELLVAVRWKVEEGFFSKHAFSSVALWDNPPWLTLLKMILYATRQRMILQTPSGSVRTEQHRCDLLGWLSGRLC